MTMTICNILIIIIMICIISDAYRYLEEECHYYYYLKEECHIYYFVSLIIFLVIPETTGKVHRFVTEGIQEYIPINQMLW